ncbi:transporter [Sulfurihydrogenibium subterraneum]|uniref:transporter n=1 Tax=Sulfurihydrogenibium subterraneum TaxID=171121 RepID=UPI00049142A7|nr:transporter [Sulfurihydrogenibium subterraneum]
MNKKLISGFLVILTLSINAFAGKKALIWDDTETLGTGNYQNENYFFYKKHTDESDGSYIFNFTYGYNDKTDLALNIPFGYLKNYENAYSDISDPFVEVKYRFFEKDGLKFAIKPFLGIPVKKDSDFSEHHLSYGITLVSQADFERLTFYANTSFMVHKNRISGQNEFFQSISAEYYLTDALSVITTFYLSSYDKTEKGGLIGIGYSKGKVEIGIGLGKIFNPDNNYSFYGGITFKFF